MKKFDQKVIMMITMCAVAFSACNKQDVSSSLSNPLSLQSTVTNNLVQATSNWNSHVANVATLTTYNVANRINSNADKESVIDKIVADDAVVASGNIMDATSMQLNTVAELQSQNADTKTNMRTYLESNVNIGDLVVNISWKSAQKSFVSKAIVHDTLIAWDNLLTNTVMMNQTPTATNTNAIGNNSTNSITSSKVYAAWYSLDTHWDIDWIWGSKRGEIGYGIKIYCYSSGYVYNTDNSDWGYMDLGSAKSYSKTLVNSGSYGKVQYALGIATPAVSLSFDSKGFKVSASGIGSNVVKNGTESLVPW
jgi:hypothetical protein